MPRRREHPLQPALSSTAAVGLGKTHLLQAIAWQASRLGRRVLYLTAEKFMFGFVAALKNQTALAFKEALRGIDLLIIDDLQFLQGKSVQQEFCHTLNALIDSGRPVVIAADRPPGELESLDERVRSRLAGGLPVEIGPLEEELRRSILAARIGQIRAKHPGFEVPGDVVDYVAAQVTANGRDLDGALNRLLAHNTLTSCAVTLEMAEHAIRDLVRNTDNAQAGADRGHHPPRRRALRHHQAGHPVLAPHRQCRAAAAGGDVPGQDADPALAAGDRPAGSAAATTPRCCTRSARSRRRSRPTGCLPTRSSFSSGASSTRGIAPAHPGRVIEPRRAFALLQILR